MTFIQQPAAKRLFAWHCGKARGVTGMCWLGLPHAPFRCGISTLLHVILWQLHSPQA